MRWEMLLTTTSALSQKQLDELQVWWSKYHLTMPNAEPQKLILPLDNHYIEFELRRG